MKKFFLLFTIATIFFLFLGCNENENEVNLSPETNDFGLNKEALDYLNVSNIDYYDPLKDLNYQQKVESLASVNNGFGIYSTTIKDRGSRVASSIENFYHIQFNTKESGYIMKTENENRYLLLKQNSDNYYFIEQAKMNRINPILIFMIPAIVFCFPH